MSSSGKVLLVYTGSHATAFNDHGIGEVEPGGEFEVPAGDEERFTLRPDVEKAGKAVKAKARPEAATD